MDAFHRLIRFGHAAKARALPVWKASMLRSEPALQWLKPRFWRGLRWLLQWLRHRRRPVMVIIVGGVLLYLSLPYWPQVWGTYKGDRESFTPFFTPIGALLVGLAAFGQWRTARLRHEEQTNADRQRRITESFSKAVEQLGNDKLEVRLGGIYSLERISKESPDDYWTVMESLTAFVRERSRRNEAERTSRDLEQRISCRAYFRWLEAGRPGGRAEDFWAEAIGQEELGEPPATDIAAALTVITRRIGRSREREEFGASSLDLSGAVLKRANLRRANLEWIDLTDARLEAANLSGANLKWAILTDAHLEAANLSGANLERARLRGTHLKGARFGDFEKARLARAYCWGLHLEGADLRGVNFEEAQLQDAHLEGADLSGANLEQANLAGAHLKRANLWGASLEGINLGGGHLEGANLGVARLERANLGGAHLEEANLWKACLGGANLIDTTGLSDIQILTAYGDAATILPPGLARPGPDPLDDESLQREADAAWRAGGRLARAWRAWRGG